MPVTLCARLAPQTCAADTGRSGTASDCRRRDVTRNLCSVGEERNCEHCGTPFAPRREHARFCSARCRVAWNRAARSDKAPAEASALEWSITAMRDSTHRLPRGTDVDRPRAFAVISEAVWWVTIVDGTLVRYHPEAYDRELRSRSLVEQSLIEETLAGLRFVRNQMGQDVDHIDFIRPKSAAAGAHNGHVRAWTWNQMPEPACASLSARGQEWELSRYRAYVSRLAGQAVGQTFRVATEFLLAASALAASLGEAEAVD